MRNAFIDELTVISEDPKVLTLLSDNGIIVFDRYRERFPNQLINFGISEATSIGVAAGLASSGYQPFVYSISPFITCRVYEHIRNDICYQNLNVTVVGTGAGYAYSSLGPTHHATEDMAFMRVMPNMTVVSPADPMETRKATQALYHHQGPAYLRIGTGRNPEVYQEDYEFTLGKGVLLRPGNDITLISTGTILDEVLKAADSLEQEGVSTRVVNIHTLFPLDHQIILDAAAETKRLLVIEEHSILGGLGGAIAEILMEQHDEPLKFKRMGLPGTFAHGYGSVADLRQKNGLTDQHICAEAQQLLS